MGGLGSHDRLPRSNYGSFGDGRDMAGSPVPTENAEGVKRHLVQPDQGSGRYKAALRMDLNDPGAGLDYQDFSSLRLQGGDMTRAVYRWAEEQEENQPGRGKRSKSFSHARQEPESEVLDIQNIKVPGGFRRNFIRRAAESPDPSGRILNLDGTAETWGRPLPNGKAKAKPQLFTNNFLEFLTLYGHFAGEELEEDDEVLEPDEYFSSDAWEGASDRDPGEDSALLTPGTPGLRKRKHKERRTGGTNSSFNAAMLLLKSFVGTGVLFLPRAFLNGGMAFANLILLFIAVLSYYCFLLLVSVRLKVPASFGDMGGVIYGKHFRNLINFSLVNSQIGFASAYIVFVSENLQAFILAVSKCATTISIQWVILMQMIIFLPLSLYRNINNIQKMALIADLFICLGLIYIYFYDVKTMVHQGGVADDIVLFNAKDWTLFIGTAIFTFEGIGLIIPIQSGMKEPKKFPKVLAIVMVIISVIFISAGALSYAAYGGDTRTVIILNLPQDDKLVNGVQFLYSLAILLSTPLQIYPAIEITSQQLFSKTGKYNPWIKWQKNVFRFFMVVLCAAIAWAGANDLDKFASLVGSFACIPLVYIYPPLMHYRAVSTKAWQKIADVALVIFGFVVMVYTTGLTLFNWVYGDNIKPPGYCDER